MKTKFAVPLALFLGLAVFFAIGLTHDPREIPSPLIDKPAPDFTLPQLHAQDRTLSLADMKGKVWLLNVWASWCAACREEHPLLVAMSKAKLVPIIGLDYKDQTPDALAWLQEHGDPYDVSIVDAEGRVGINFGVYGVPETFLIDQQGRIRFKHIGPLTRKVVDETLLPQIKALQNG
ncbi:DsbE family thiol:disulfide interchange protein [Uliginosibacterium sp. H1]|uniref:DsbE family thiol:disulfide interchange protein n=1 Tax=Uliginosibacterium sp. H1 TaxID=3114757 RepID=UPI002E188A0B|nr:DsbE family thiol:disulfide interchange protein [Uliginosibacterium sp. H1]